MTTAMDLAAGPRHYATSRAKRRSLYRHYSKKAGLVFQYAQAAYSYGVPFAWWPAPAMKDREDLLDVVAALRSHVEPGRCAGNGRSCACRILGLTLAAFDAEAMRKRADRRELTLAAIMGTIGIAAFLYLFDYFMNGALNSLRQGGRSAEYQFSYLVGIGGGLAVGAFTILLSSTTSLLRIGYGLMDHVGRHPDSGAPFFGMLLPPVRRRLRTARLRREILTLEALMRSSAPSGDGQPTGPERGGIAGCRRPMATQLASIGILVEQTVRGWIRRRGRPSNGAP